MIGTRRIRGWWRDRSPVVTRARALAQASRARADGLRSADEELARVRAELDPIVRAGSRIRAGVAQTSLGETYRCSVDFDPYLMRSMLRQGDSRLAIRMIAESLAREVEAAITRVNWQRFSEDEEARLSRSDRYRRPGGFRARADLGADCPGCRGEGRDAGCATCGLAGVGRPR